MIRVDECILCRRHRRLGAGRPANRVGVLLGFLHLDAGQLLGAQLLLIDLDVFILFVIFRLGLGFGKPLCAPTASGPGAFFPTEG